MTPLPPVPVGDSNLVQWAILVLQAIRERTPIRGAAVDIQETPGGFRVIPHTPPPSGAGGLNYRGEYNDKPEEKGDDFGNTDPWTKFDVVRVSPDNDAADTDTLGADAALPGIYVCVKDGPTSADWPVFPEPDADADHFWDLLSTFPAEYNICKDGKVVAVYADAQPKPADPAP